MILFVFLISFNLFLHKLFFLFVPSRFLLSFLTTIFVKSSPSLSFTSFIDSSSISLFQAISCSIIPVKSYPSLSSTSSVDSSSISLLWAILCSIIPDPSTHVPCQTVLLAQRKTCVVTFMTTNLCSGSLYDVYST